MTGGLPSLRVFSAASRLSPRRPLSSSISSAFARLSAIKRPIFVSSASQTADRAYAVGQSSSSSFMTAGAVGSDGSAPRGRRVRSVVMKSWDAKRANRRVVWSEIGCLRTRVKRFAHAGSPVIKGLSLLTPRIRCRRRRWLRSGPLPALPLSSQLTVGGTRALSRRSSPFR